MLDQKVTGICPTGAVAGRIEAIRTGLCELWRRGEASEAAAAGRNRQRIARPRAGSARAPLVSTKAKALIWAVETVPSARKRMGQRSF
jgi:hypothetical protein